MDRNRLARHAYNTACDRIARDTSLSIAEKRADLRAADCTTTKDWERWARERREYEEPYAPIGRRY